MESDSDNATIGAYNKFANVYDAEVVDFWNNFPPTILKAFKNNLPGKRVLDLGSGTGRDALLLRNMGCEVECVDGSEVMVQLTRSMGFESRKVRFEDFVLSPESYDGVWAYTSLLHVSKEIMKRSLVEVARGLVPNGLLLLGMIEGDFEGMVERKTMPDVARYFKYYSEAELDQMVLPLGFKKIFEGRYSPASKTYLNQLYIKVE